MSILTDQEYNKKMEELGLIEDADYGKYFLGDMAFLMNVDVDECGIVKEHEGRFSHAYVEVKCND